MQVRKTADQFEQGLGLSKGRPFENKTSQKRRVHLSATVSVFYLSSILYLLWGPRMDRQKLQAGWAVLRGIGKSFQSAITAPRMNLTGYGNATAQS